MARGVAGTGTPAGLRRSPLTGGKVSQAQYRRERLQVLGLTRREYDVARQSGTYIAPPRQAPPPRPVSRRMTPGRWHQTPSGQTLRTGNNARAAEGIRGAARRGNDLIVEVRAGNVVRGRGSPEPSRPSHQDRAYLGRFGAEDIAAAVEEANGDVRAALEGLFEMGPEYDTVSGITEISLREYPG